MSHYRKSLMFLLGVWALAACYPTTAPVQPYPPTQAPNRPLPTSVPSGKEVAYADFRVTMAQADVTTSYITEYGSRRDAPAGTEFLWIHILLKNVGKAERGLPAIEHFSVLYGASEFKPIYGHRHGLADYTTLKSTIYQGQQVDAWLRFDVPTGAQLKDLQFAFLPESFQVSTSFAPTDYPWSDHPIYVWTCSP